MADVDDLYWSSVLHRSSRHRCGFWFSSLVEFLTSVDHVPLSMEGWNLLWNLIHELDLILWSV
jgi:hypothetical protein